MGITGLIPFLDKAATKIYLKDIKGSTVAIDTYCWLHKGAFGCADKLARGEYTNFYIQYCLKYVNLLLANDIKPILVFDGRHLPAKELTEKRRRESRKECQRKAKELLREGKTDQASSFLKRSIDVTHEMALNVIQECRRRNVDCIVAPYEADAQMAYLNKINVADYIITEDSDLVLFGTTKTIFKLDLAGQGLLIDSNKLHLAMGCSEIKYSFDKFRIMCILSGCDYLDSLPGIGLAKACKFVLLTEETDLKKSLLKLPSYLNLKNVVVTQDYIDNFLVAEATFKHMFVYCPIKRAVVRLNEIPGDHPEIEALCKNAGVNDLDEETAFNLALGNLNPFGLKKLDDFNPDTHKLTPSNKFEKITVAKHSSIWLKNFKKHQPKSNEKLCAFQFVTKSKDKILNKVVENLEDDEKSEEDESSIMEMYAQKEYLSYNEDNFKDLEEKEHNSINKKRNPFGKSVSERDIFKENTTSLLKTLSPKKREIKTVREVRSRFFLPFVKQENSSKNNDNSKKSLENVEKYINDPLKSEKRKCSDDLQRPPKQLFTEKIKTENNNDVEVEGIIESEPSKSDSGLSLQSSVESENDEDEDVKFVSEVKIEKTNFLENFKTKSSKPRIKSVGLSKPKTSKIIEKSKNQSSLSMFGFQKKQSI